MKKHLTILSFVTAWLIPWSSTDASFSLKDFVCETDKTISCLSISITGNDIEDMKKDLEVCKCLEDKFGLKIKDSLTQEERDQKIYEAKLLSSLLELGNNSWNKTNPYLLESALINPDNPTEAVKHVFDTMRAEELSKWAKKDLEMYRNKVSPRFLERIYGEIDHYSNTDNLIKYINKSKDKINERGFCLSYEGFLSTKMIPESHLFWQALGSNKKFNPNEWNASILEAELDRGENVELNNAKLTFLEMNPTIKAAFKGNNLKLQEALHDSLKKILIPDTRCIKKNDCQGRFVNSGHNLPNLLKEFYEEQNVRADISGYLFIDLRNEASILNKVDDRRPNLSSIRLASENKTASYKECGGGIDPQKTGECADYLQKYCTDLRTSGDSIIPIQNDEQVNNKRFRLDDSIFLPADENTEYFQINELACKKLKRKDNTTKKVMTYPEFKVAECSRIDCTKLTDIDIYKIFINNTKSLDDGIFFKNQNNTELLILGIVKSQTVNLNEEVLSIASRDNSVLRDKESENMSIIDVIGNIEKPKLPPPTQAVTSVTTTTAEGRFSAPENLPEGESLDTSIAGHDISLQNLGTFGNQAYLNAPNQFFSKVEEEAADKKESDINSKDTNSFASSLSEGPKKESIESMDMTLEERIKGLEKLLAEKDSSTKSYQKMINQLLEHKGNTQAAQLSKSAVSPETSETLVDKKTPSTKSTVYNTTKPHKDQQPSQMMDAERNTSHENFPRDVARAPASLGSSSTGQSFAATTSKRVNNALLTKYGIVVKDGPTGSSSSVSVAEEADNSKFSGVKSIAEAANVPLQVSVKDFEQIKTNNLGALEALYTKELKGINDQVVKVLVSTNSSEEILEFYAIKEEGRVVFQPIRKNKLIDLQNVLHR